MGEVTASAVPMGPHWHLLNLCKHLLVGVVIPSFLPIRFIYRSFRFRDLSDFYIIAAYLPSWPWDFWWCLFCFQTAQRRIHWQVWRRIHCSIWRGMIASPLDLPSPPPHQLPFLRGYPIWTDPPFDEVPGGHVSSLIGSHLASIHSCSLEQSSNMCLPSGYTLLLLPGEWVHQLLWQFFPPNFPWWVWPWCDAVLCHVSNWLTWFYNLWKE